ncbi:hypothetical protein ELE36_07075 [Pseudolysobacter antarcticus]|uniref:DUF4167 domain-containing protein n=1 Tax=Pseudolysobacter antarcticus TaxID=2511995 RepID=A0A411HI05_9GAMM|nr:hypothetical protein [Pseudolysobacter antarcticus]QBB70145.1 hypothetical protein ELE36_07075 [Pseudolysobacter antarcticus]
MKSSNKVDAQRASTAQHKELDELSHVQYHEKAVEHHKQAANQHAEAAKYYGEGDDAKAAYHAHLATGYGLLAKLHAYEANMHFSKKHSASHH